MDNEVLKQYQGFINTPSLWQNQDFEGLEQFSFEKESISNANHNKFSETRLGKRAEQFLFDQIHRSNNSEIIGNNIQIKQKKQTIGEIDAVIKHHSELIHLESVFKFYLYDPLNADFIDKWVGPNKNDTLRLKIKKLKNKQLPLLFNPNTNKVLQKLGINVNKVKQRVCFKAQLFLPFNNPEISVNPFTSNCVYGFYLNFKDLDVLNEAQFYIPKKINWLVDAHEYVKWLDFNQIKTLIRSFIDNKRSPLIWVKNNSTICKYFITWW